MRLSDVRIIDLAKYLDPRGNLSVIEQLGDVPFEIRRAYWIYDVPGGEKRGGHAYRENCEFVVALSGSFDVVLDDGFDRKTYSLNRSYYGLYVPNGIWREMNNFSTNSLALILSSTDFSEDDYIMDYDSFKAMAVAGALDKAKMPLKSSVGAGLPNGADMLAESEHVPASGMAAAYNLSGNSSVYDCAIVELPKFFFPEGNLTPVQGSKNLPFDIKRVFYSYDIPGGESRGAHAHKQCHQFLVAASGAFEVVLDDGVNRRTVLLNRPFYGVHVPPGIWASEQGFSSGSVCLVLASELYSKQDYISDYDKFLEFRKTLQK